MLNEINSQEKANTAWSCLYVESKNVDLTVESRMVIAEAGRIERREGWDVVKDTYLLLYKRNKFKLSLVCQHGDYS
jgi:hypothetical protein